MPISLDLNMLMPAPIVNVPSSPPVNVRNEVNVPQAQSITICPAEDDVMEDADERAEQIKSMLATVQD